MSQKSQHSRLCNSFEELQKQVKRQCVQFSTPQNEIRNEIRYVSRQLKMIPPYDSTILTIQQRKEAVMQARQILQEIDSFWIHVYEIRVITVYDDEGADQKPKNCINLRTKPDFVSMIYHERIGTCPEDEVVFCFMASDQLEPIITVVVLNAEQGKLVEISRTQVDWLQDTLNNFKSKYGLSGERFAYTPIKYRVKSKMHSKHFHVKIRIPTDMYIEVFPSFRMLAGSRSDLQMRLFQLEPIEYAFSRQPAKLPRYKPSN